LVTIIEAMAFIRTTLAKLNSSSKLDEINDHHRHFFLVNEATLTELVHVKVEKDQR